MHFLPSSIMACAVLVDLSYCSITTQIDTTTVPVTFVADASSRAEVEVAISADRSADRRLTPITWSKFGIFLIVSWNHTSCSSVFIFVLYCTHSIVETYRPTMQTVQYNNVMCKTSRNSIVLATVDIIPRNFNEL